VKRKRKVTHCYLCGQPLVDGISADHVPPSLFFGEELRKRHQLNLLTIPTHKSCNHSFQSDEEYVVYTLMPFSRGSEAGNAVWNQTMSKLQSGRNVPLSNQVLTEFRRNVGGIILPASKVAKIVDANRLHNVIWKIIRGLYFRHHGVILPWFWNCGIRITVPGETPPEEFLALTGNGLLRSQGRYPGVFAYSMHKFPEVNDLHYWAFLLWDRIIITAAFHDVECKCEYCSFVGPSLPEPLDRTRKL
jgi:hypothetical protein